MCNIPAHSASGSGPNRPRVLFVINSLAGGGAERVMTTLLNNSHELRQSQEIALAILDDDGRDFDLPPGLRTFQLDSRHNTIRSIRGIERVVRSYKPDVTLSFLTRSNLASAIAMLRRRRPCIVSERTSTSAHLGTGPRQLVTKALIRLAYPRASKVIAVSTGVAAKLASSFGVSQSRLAVIPNPVDIARIGHEARGPLGLAVEKPYIAAVGRLVPVKNYQLLVQAFARADLPCRLVIAGEGPERKALAALASDLGIADRVLLPGWLSNPYPLLRGAALFALSSNVEGFPNALVEALALGVPAIATNCCDGPAEILARKGGEEVSGLTVADAGILSPVGDVESYARALRLGFDGAVRGKLIGAARKRADDYAASAIATRYWEVIEQVLERRRAHARN